MNISEIKECISVLRRFNSVRLVISSYRTRLRSGINSNINSTVNNIWETLRSLEGLVITIGYSNT